MKATKPLTQKQIYAQVSKRILNGPTPTPALVHPILPVPKSVKKRVPKLILPLSSMASQFRHLKPSWRTYIEYAMLGAKDGDKDMLKYVATYQSLSKKEQETHSPEQVCELSGVKEDILFGSVARMIWKVARNEAALITAINHPLIIEKTAKYAMGKNGVKDREMFHKSTGFLPPTGGGIHINNNPQTLIAANGSERVLLPSVKDDMDALGGLDFLPPITKQIEAGTVNGNVESTQILEGDTD